MSFLTTRRLKGRALTQSLSAEATGDVGHDRPGPRAVKMLASAREVYRRETPHRRIGRNKPGASPGQVRPHRDVLGRLGGDFFGEEVSRNVQLDSFSGLDKTQKGFA